MKLLSKPAVQLGFASLLLIVAVILTFSMYSKAREADIWRAHSLIVMTKANKTLASIMAAEANQRGYLLTADKAYLKPYHDESESLFRELADLRQLTSDNPHQQQHVDELITLLKKRVSIMSQGIELRRQQHDRAALETDKENLTNAAVISIQAVMNDFLTTEQNLLSLRENQLKKSFELLLILTSGLGVSVIVVVLVSSRLLVQAAKEKTNVQTGLNDELNRTLSSLRSSEARYRMLVDGTKGVAFIMLDKNGLVTSWNNAAKKLKGFTYDDVAGRHFSMFYPPEMTAAGRPEAELEQARSQGHFENFEYRVRKDGSMFWAHVSITPLYDDKGELQGYSKITSDYSDRKNLEDAVHVLNSELELRVAARTAELEVANKDLEGFAYSVSHDLRAPLRAIDGFSAMLREEYAPQLDEEGKRKLQVVSDNAKKMGQLIDDILAFSRAGRLEFRMTRIDMNILVQQMWKELAPLREGRVFDFRVANLPAVQGDATAIRQIWQNLLENAIKFTSARSPAVIEVGGQIVGNEAAYFVRDNGAGFDMAYQNKLFGMFQRLHGMEEFPGTGVGLAIVKRYVSKHKGHVAAEGKPGEGATFRFTLPAMASFDEALTTKGEAI